MANLNVTPEAVEQLVQQCKEEGDKAHERPGCAAFMRTLWSAEIALRAQAERIAELEKELSATVAERNRAMKACEQIRKNALREALDKVHKTDAGADEYANIPSDFAAGIEAACEDIKADILALIEGASHG